MSDYSIAFLHILADHAAIAIENARDVSRIQQLTITDDTTGLFNVRHLYEVLSRELKRSTMHKLPLSLAFWDLDRFKLINDAHGHMVGSELLALTGRRLQKLSREQDRCFRYGGDEFVILMPETPAAQALALTKGIHAALMETPFGMKSGLTLKVSASVGLSSFPGDGTRMHEIIGTADARMYAVKRHGRGHVRAD
jgi:diguanylate cyclase (GGDEF)-like protein